MSVFSNASRRFHYARNNWRRNDRLKYPSPAELKFIELFGGKVFVVPFLRHYKTKYQRVIIWRGKYLRHEFMQREVRVGAMYIDFAFHTAWYRRGIEIDGKHFHRDIVKEQNRDDYLHKYGWRILHIPAEDLYRRPDKVRERVIQFLSQ